MRTLNYKETYQKLLTPEIVSYLTQIHEQKGQQNLFIEAHKDALTELLEIAKIQSTEASNRIEGIITTDERLKKIVRNKTAPRNRSEREIAGYRDVLETIHENYDFIPVRPNMILQLHRDLYKFNNPGIGGNYKNSDNIISEKYSLTIQEASEYFSIGVKKMRRLAEENVGRFSVFSGNRYLILREKFETYLSQCSAI